MDLARLFRRRAESPQGEYGHEVRSFDLPEYGAVRFAHWLHPYNQSVVIAPSTMKAVRRFISPGDFAIDIGAHAGDTTVPMALAAGRSGLTLALEPNPYAFRVLEANAKLNTEKSNIEPRCFAATDSDGRFVFHYSDASFCNGGFKSQQRWWLYRRKYPLTVTGRNLFQVLRTDYVHWLPRLSYIKVDAEGYDRAILNSLLPILRVFQPVVRTEVFRKLVTQERFALYDLLTSAGYDVHRYVEQADPLAERLQRDAMIRRKHFDVVAVPRKLASVARRVA